MYIKMINMLRFINIGKQICNEDKLCFAWYDTVIGEFLSFNGSNTWNSWREFDVDCMISPYQHDKSGKYNKEFDITRFKKLYPRRK